MKGMHAFESAFESFLQALQPAHTSHLLPLEL